MSGAAATLLGLMFVVIALAAERRSGDAAKIHIYLTPTVIYFASVLCLAALLTFPTHTRLTASLCTCLAGFAGLVYSGSFFRIVRGGKKNYYELQDWIVLRGSSVCGIRGPGIRRSLVLPCPPTRTHLGGCRYAVVARACGPQLLVHRHRRRLHLSCAGDFKVAYYRMKKPRSQKPGMNEPQSLRANTGEFRCP